jgi:hypothetical protein
VNRLENANTKGCLDDVLLKVNNFTRVKPQLALCIDNVSILQIDADQE